MNTVLIRIIAFFAALSAMLLQLFRIPAPLPAVPAYVEAEADALAKKATAHQTENTITFIAASDSHQPSLNGNLPMDSPENIAAQNTINGNRHAGNAMELLTHSMKIDFCAFLGDYTVGGKNTTVEEGLRQIREVNADIDAAFSGLPQFRTMGNHDPLGYSYKSTGKYLTAEELAPLIAAYNEGAVFGDPVSGYCYRDFAVGRRTVRVICLNTSEFTEETSAIWNGDAVEGLSMAQRKWFTEVLMDTGEKGEDWSIIVLSHHPPDWGSTVAASNIIHAYVTGGSVIFNGKTYDFHNRNAAKFICAFHGHTHCYKTDRLRTVSDYKATVYNAYRMAIPNMCFSRNNEYGQNGKPEYFGIEFGDADTYNKTAGTANDTAFCVITIDLETQTIYAYHYGAGPAENDKCRILHYASFGN